jgi:titin
MGHTIQGNYIGVGSDGVTALGNGGGIAITNSANNQIGGSTQEARNIISASTAGYGVAIQGNGATGNLVEGNYIGTDATGSLRRGNRASGVGLIDTTGNTVRGNVISGNSDSGVFLVGGTPTTDITNLIEDNYIGTDASGTADLGNTLMGVRVSQGFGAVVRGNVLSGNDNSNIHVDATGSGVLIEDNLIGTDRTGKRPLLNPRGLPGGGLTLVGRDNRCKLDRRRSRWRLAAWQRSLRHSHLARGE